MAAKSPPKASKILATPIDNVEDSRAQRLQRQQSRFRDRGGIFIPSKRDTLAGILLGTASPLKKLVRRSKSRSLSVSPTKGRRKSAAAVSQVSQQLVPDTPVPINANLRRSPRKASRASVELDEGGSSTVSQQQKVAKPPKVPASKSRGKTPTRLLDVQEVDEDEDDDLPLPPQSKEATSKKPTSRSKQPTNSKSKPGAVPSGKTTKKKKAVVETDEEVEERDNAVMPPPPSKTKKSNSTSKSKAPPKSKPRKKVPVDHESEGEDEPPKKSSKTSPKATSTFKTTSTSKTTAKSTTHSKAKFKSDVHLELEPETIPAPQPTLRKRKYDLYSCGESEDEYVPPAKTVKAKSGAASKAKANAKPKANTSTKPKAKLNPGAPQLPDIMEEDEEEEGPDEHGTPLTLHPPTQKTGKKAGGTGSSSTTKKSSSEKKRRAVDDDEEAHAPEPPKKRSKSAPSKAKKTVQEDEPDDDLPLAPKFSKKRPRDADADVEEGVDKGRKDVKRKKTGPAVDVEGQGDDEDLPRKASKSRAKDSTKSAKPVAKGTRARKAPTKTAKRKENNKPPASKTISKPVSRSKSQAQTVTEPVRKGPPMSVLMRIQTSNEIKHRVLDDEPDEIDFLS